MNVSPGADPDVEHPGLTDPVYRARRQAITSRLDGRHPGDPIPVVDYTEAETVTWQVVSAELSRSHERYACARYLAAADRLALPTDRVPQLAEVSDRLADLTGFRIEPVPGLVPTRVFYGSLADRRFLSTQYVRHPDHPRYTTEPDIIHELIGHAVMLADPRFAEVYRRVGEAVARTRQDDAVEYLSRVFWHTIEFGLVQERGELRTYGAGLLSSCGEILEFRNARVVPFDLEAMGRRRYDITHYQHQLFVAADMDSALDELEQFFGGFDEADLVA